MLIDGLSSVPKLFQQISDMSRIFSFFFVCFLAISSLSNAAEPNNYLVEGVSVNVTGKTPSGARTLAVAMAHRDAFLILLTRLEMNINTADNVGDDEISDMVRSEQIESEKFSGNNYSGTFNIMFAKDFVDHILAQKNLQKVSGAPQVKSEDLLLLLPIKMVKRRPFLWEDENDWKKALAQNLSKRSQTKFLIPEGDVSNIALVNRDNIALVDYSGLEPMLLKYKSEGIYKLFFSYDDIENKVSIDVVYLRKLQKKQIKLSFINVDRLSYEALLSKVAEKTVDYLLSSQNNVEVSKNLNPASVRLGIYITSLGNWLMIKNKIESSNLVNQLNIEALSRDYVVISVNYIDPRVDIVEAFSRIGISLDKKSDNFYTLTAY